ASGEKLQQLPLPPGADLKGAQGAHLIFTLRDEWTPAGQTAIAKGSLIAYRMPEDEPIRAKDEPPGAKEEPVRGKSVSVLYAPDSRSSVDEGAAGRRAAEPSPLPGVARRLHCVPS